MEIWALVRRVTPARFKVASVERRCSLAICSLSTAGLRCRVESYHIRSLLLDSLHLDLTRRVHDGLLFASRLHFKTL